MPPKNKDNFTPSTWVREVDGKTYERVAETPSEEVQYKFDGWRLKDTKAKSAAAAADSSSSAKAASTKSS